VLGGLARTSALPRAAAAALAAGLTLLLLAPVGLTAAAVAHTTGADHCLHAEPRG
jgi:hypothetical protein